MFRSQSVRHPASRYVYNADYIISYYIPLTVLDHAILRDDPRSFRTCIPGEHVLRKYVLSIFIVTEEGQQGDGKGGHGPYAHIMRGRERDLRYTAQTGIIRICDSKMLLYIITFMNRPS